MKMIIAVALALVAIAAAAPASAPTEYKQVAIIRSDFKQREDGSYSSDLETEDGINKQEVGELKEVLDEEKKPHKVVVVRGSYSYPDENGKRIEVTYEADENGYRAFGDSIPKPNQRR